MDTKAEPVMGPDGMPPHTLRSEVLRSVKDFESFRRERIDRDQRINNRWFQAFIALGFSMVMAAGSVVWFASNADGRIERNTESIEALRMNDQRLIDMAARLARTEALVTATDKRTSRIERAIDVKGYYNDE